MRGAKVAPGAVRGGCRRLQEAAGDEEGCQLLGVFFCFYFCSCLIFFMPETIIEKHMSVRDGFVNFQMENCDLNV